MKSEDRIQQECVLWFWNTYPELRTLLFSVPNGGARSAREGKLLKDTGLTPGVSDLIFLYHKKAYLLETKNEVGVQSKAQKAWERVVWAEGFDYYLFYNLQEFQKIIIKIIQDAQN